MDLTERVAVNLGLNGLVTTELELALALANGLSTESVAALMRHGIPEAELFVAVLSRRTYLRRRSKNERLTTDESDRAERVARLLALAQIIFDDDLKAARWMTKPKDRFDGHSPLVLARSSAGARVVEEVLLQAYFGFAA